MDDSGILLTEAMYGRGDPVGPASCGVLVAMTVDDVLGNGTSDSGSVWMSINPHYNSTLVKRSIAYNHVVKNSPTVATMTGAPNINWFSI